MLKTKKYHWKIIHWPLMLNKAIQFILLEFYLLKVNFILKE